MAGINLSPILRRLGALSDVRLGLAYTCGIFPAVLLREWAAKHPGLTWLQPAAAILALISVSALIAVIAFYRDDDLLLSGVLLAAITGIGTVMALALTAAILTGSIGAALVLAPAGFFAIVLRLILIAPIMAGAVWVARKFRRYIAPDTMSFES